MPAWIDLPLKLHIRQHENLERALESGLYGATIEEVATRFIDAGLIEFNAVNYPKEPDDRESWQRGGDDD